MSAGAPANPGQDPNQPQVVPSIKSLLIGAIPFVGPSLAAHAMLKHRQELDKQTANEKYNDAMLQHLHDMSVDEKADPDVRQNSLNLMHAAMSDRKLGKQFGKEITEPYINLATNHSRTVAPTLNVPNLGAQQAPPDTGAQTPGEGYGAAPPALQPPSQAVAQPQGAPQQQPGAGRSIEDLANSPNMYERGQAKNAMNSLAVAMQQGSAAYQASVRRAVSNLAAIGMTPQQLPVEAWTELVDKGTITRLPALGEGQVQPSVTGDNIAAGPPKPITTPEGATTVIPPAAQTISNPGLQPPGQAIGGAPGLAPPPGSAPAGYTTVATSPPKLSESEANVLNAAKQVAQENGLPFDEKANPRNPMAQLPPALHNKVRAIVAEGKIDPEMRAQRLHMMQIAEQSKQIQMQLAQQGAALRQQARDDRSYQFAAGEVDKVAKPIIETATRLQRLQDTLAQGTPVSDALVAPELLTVSAGGVGSGLRMSEAEISRVFGARSNWENLRAKLQKWNTDPKEARSITPAQEGQIRQLVTALSEKANKKQEIISKVGRQLSQSADVSEHRKLAADMRDQLLEVDKGESLKPPPGAAPPLPQKLSDKDVGRTFTSKDGKKIKITAVNPNNPQQFKYE